MKPTVAVVLNVRNEDATLRSVLEAASGFDEYVVADMESTDATVAVAQDWGAKILRLPNAGFCEPGRQPALDSVESDWALILDGDEYLSPGANQVLREAAERAEENVAGFRIVRHAYIGNRRICASGWEPAFESPVRLVRPRRVQWPPIVHAVPHVNGEIEKLDETQVHIRHDNFHDLFHFFQKNLWYAKIEGLRIAAEGGSIEVTAGIEEGLKEFRRRYNPEVDGSLSLALASGILMSRFAVELFAAEALGWPPEEVQVHDLLESSLQTLSDGDGEAEAVWHTIREADKTERQALTEELRVCKEELESARDTTCAQAVELEEIRSTAVELRTRLMDVERLALRPQQDLAARLNRELEAATELNLRLLADLKASQVSVIAWQLATPTHEARCEEGQSAAWLLGRRRRVTPGQ